MAPMLLSRTTYQERESGTFSRQCIGSEAFACRRSEDSGFAHTFSSCKVTFGDDISADDLKHKVQRSFIRLRYLVPSIACTTSRPSDAFQFDYHVPTSLEDAVKWCDEVVFVNEDGTSFQEHHDCIVSQRWWRASEGRYTYELHVTPNLMENSASWTFTLSAHHGNADARVVFMIFDKFFEYLVEEITNVAPPLSSLVWGEETCRLSPAGPAVWALDEPFVPNPAPVGQKFPPELSAEEQKRIPWSYPVRVTSNSSRMDITVAVNFSREQTNQFRAACRAHDRTVTQVATALFALADLQSALRNAGVVGVGRFKELQAGFKKATHFVSKFNAVDMRQHMPEAYRTFGAECSTPLMASDGFQLAFPFEPFRKMLSPDETRLDVTRKFDASVFWEELVASVADAWKSQDMSPKAYRQRAVIIDSLVSLFNSASFADNVSPSTSSFGDLTQLGLLNSFLPTSGNKTLVVEDVAWSMRSNMPNGIAGFYQYNGQFRITVTRGAKYTTQEELDSEGGMLEEWMREIIARSP